MISPVLDFIKECRKPNYNERKRLCKVSKTLLSYWKDLKINKKGLLVKATNSVEQIVFPKQFKAFVFEELHNKIGHLGFNRVVQLCRNHLYWPRYESNIQNYKSCERFATKSCKRLKNKMPMRSQSTITLKLLWQPSRLN